MNTSENENLGYVYILKVRDIDLPVCKIGRTSKSPETRCAEINRSSTGDFLWQVAHQIPVNDCKGFERLVHKKLEWLRQKNREFFNVTAEKAFTAVRFILEEQTEIQEIDPKVISGREGETSEPTKPGSPSRDQFQPRDSKYAEILALFTQLTDCKGRPFGQLNQPHFGMSDGNDGVQWNISVYRETEDIQLGVNLEGKVYANWPIATFLLAELQDPSIFDIRAQLNDPARVFMRHTRDAWQVTARPSIVEKYIGPSNVSLSDIDAELWQSMLTEALGCLSKGRGYRGRSKQLVTITSQSNTGERKRMMTVSPHLTIWTPIESSDDIERRLKVAIDRLKPLYNWVSRISRSDRA